MFITDLIQYPERLLHGFFNFPLALYMQVFYKQLKMLRMAKQTESHQIFKILMIFFFLFCFIFFFKEFPVI